VISVNFNRWPLTFRAASTQGMCSAHDDLVFYRAIQPFNLPFSRAVPNHRHIIGCVVDLARKVSLTFCLPPPLILQGGGLKSPKSGLDFRPQSHLQRFGFEMEQRNGNLKHARWAQITGLNTDWGVPPIPHLMFTGVKIAKFQNFASTLTGFGF